MGARPRGGMPSARGIGRSARGDARVARGTGRIARGDARVAQGGPGARLAPMPAWLEGPPAPHAEGRVKLWVALAKHVYWADHSGRERIRREARGLSLEPAGHRLLELRASVDPYPREPFGVGRVERDVRRRRVRQRREEVAHRFLLEGRVPYRLPDLVEEGVY